MTPSPLYTISRKAQKILNHRGYEVVWSLSLRERYSPETFVCIRSADDILHVKLKLSPNILTSGEEIARYCYEEIRVLRRLMRTNPEKSGEHYEVWVSMPWGKFTALEVLPDMLIDQRSGAVLSPRPTGGVPA